MVWLFVSIVLLAAIGAFIRGCWAARTVLLLVLLPVVGFAGFCLVETYFYDRANDHGWIGVVVGFVIAWFVSGIPMYLAKYRSVPFDEAMSMTLR
jgi:hypothetical protein